MAIREEACEHAADAIPFLQGSPQRADLGREGLLKVIIRRDGFAVLVLQS